MRQLVTVVLLLLPLAASAARVDPVQALEALPANDREQGLWDLASGHENNIVNDGRRIENKALEAYLESIANRMLGDTLDHLGIHVDFFVVRNNVLSAWVYPYGTIAVNSGLLASMENEAQLASILAHELSHFLQRHSYRELIEDRRQGAIGKGLGLLLTAAVASETGVIDTGLMDAGGLWTDLVTSGYSRKLEHVADAEGLELMAKAGYDRAQAVRGFEILGQNEAYDLQTPRLLWSSHPKLEDRIDNLKKSVRKAQRKKDYVPGTVPDATAYYRAIADVLLINGRMDLGERQFERARMAFEKYVQARPHDGEGYFLLGESYRRAAPNGPDYDARIAEYRRAIDSDAGFADAYRELGMALRQRGDNAGARSALQRYLDVQPDAVDAGIIRGYLNGL